jgi:hypothetical protein
LGWKPCYFRVLIIKKSCKAPTAEAPRACPFVYTDVFTNSYSEVAGQSVRNFLKCKELKIFFVISHNGSKSFALLAR